MKFLQSAIFVAQRQWKIAVPRSIIELKGLGRVFPLESVRIVRIEGMSRKYGKENVLISTFLTSYFFPNKNYKNRVYCIL